MRKIALLLIPLLLAACGYRLVPGELVGGTAWGAGSFVSNGQRIYFTSTNENGERIRYSGGPLTGMMMGGYLSCASCHGPDAQGGLHTMHMEVMDAPDIRWNSLLHELEEHSEDSGTELPEYSLEDFQRAVVLGIHPDGERLDEDMPRWIIDDSDLVDLADYLKSLP